MKSLDANLLPSNALKNEVQKIFVKKKMSDFSHFNIEIKNKNNSPRGLDAIVDGPKT